MVDSQRPMSDKRGAERCRIVARLKRPGAGMTSRRSYMSDQIEEMLRNENAAWNAHDVERIAAFYTDDCFKEDIAVGKATHGKEEMKALIGGAFTAMPDMKIELLTLLHRGEWAATEWTMSGSYSRDYPGFPLAAGRRFSVRGASIMELRDGKISRISDYWNYASFLQQVSSTAGGQQT
jgi:steroid delta-isomerase-like uncharacterized protein